MTALFIFLTIIGVMAFALVMARWAIFRAARNFGTDPDPGTPSGEIEE